MSATNVRQQFQFIGSYAAAAGVQLTFRLYAFDGAGNPVNLHLYGDAVTRVTEIRR